MDKLAIVKYFKLSFMTGLMFSILIGFFSSEGGPISVCYTVVFGIVSIIAYWKYF